MVKKIKEKLSSAPVLGAFDSSAETYITSDASAVAIGAVLSQVKDGVEHPIAFASRALTPAEKNYSVGEREALAVVWAVEKWHIYTYGRAVMLYTDHRTLTTLLSAESSGQ